MGILKKLKRKKMLLNNRNLLVEDFAYFYEISRKFAFIPNIDFYKIHISIALQVAADIKNDALSLGFKAENFISINNDGVPYSILNSDNKFIVNKEKLESCLSFAQNGQFAQISTSFLRITTDRLANELQNILEQNT